MPSFELAAIKVRRELKKPLHYEDITKRALEQNLIETSGSTPEATMNAQISVDIKNKREKSAFMRVKPGYYSLNPEYSEEEQKTDEKEERSREGSQFFSSSLF